MTAETQKERYVQMKSKDDAAEGARTTRTKFDGVLLMSRLR